jgi:TetR/AcrR family transcriptional regulator, ethionamide resistance regulator
VADDSPARDSVTTVPVREGQVAGRRRRRTPEAAQREIIAAAEQLLRERPFRELTVDEVMRRTGLSRPSFYVYFKDRHDLVLRLVQQLAAEMLVVANRWYDAKERGPAMLREALEGTIAVYGEHSAVLRALADAAVDDPDVEHAYGQLVQGFVDLTAAHLDTEIRAGRMLSVQPQETAKALIWMIERYLYHAFGPANPVPPARVIDTVDTIMVRTLYGR